MVSDDNLKREKELAKIVKNLKKQNNDENNDEDNNHLYRDLEKERKEQQQAIEEQAAVEFDIEDDLPIKKDKSELELDEALKKGDIKAIKKAKKERQKQIKLAVKENKKKRAEVGEAKYGVRAFFKKIVNKIAAYKMHALRAPGDQAGVFDNKKDGNSGKRYVEHDFDFGAETVREKFTTTINGVKVSGTVTRQFDDAPDGSIQQVGRQQITISKAVSGGRSISPDKLGNLSHDSILNSIDRGKGFER